MFQSAEITAVICSVIIVSLGQDILSDFSCHKKSECTNQNIQRQLRTFQDRLNEQTIQIQNLNQRKTELEQDIDGLRDATLFLFDNIGPSDKVTTPLVHGVVPSVPPPSYAIPTTENMGIEFYLMFPSINSLYHQLMISSEQPGWILIEIPHSNTKENVTIKRGTTYRNISTSLGHYESGMKNKGIFVTSSTPISLYAINVENYIFETYALTVCHKSMLGSTYIAGAYDGHDLGIVSTSDSTTVNISLPMDTNLVYEGRLHRNEDTVSLKLDRLSTFKVLGQQSNTRDTKIMSDKPIAVLYGRDNFDFKQLRPLDNYSGSHFIIPFLDKFTLSVSPDMSNTTLHLYKRLQAYPTTLTISQSKKIDIDDFSVLESDKPVMVTIGNPKLKKSLPISPISQFSLNASCSLPYFYKPYRPAYENNIYIIAKSHSIEGIKINDHYVSDADVKHSATFLNYNITQITVNLNTSQHVHVVSENVEVSVFILGYLHNVLQSYLYIYQCGC